MKLIIVACALVAVAIAAPAVPEEPKEVKVIRSETTREPDGTYSFTLETDDGVIKQETGELKEVLNEKNELIKVVVVRGYYTTVDSEGHPHTINYTADENGYVAEGEDIPKVQE